MQETPFLLPNAIVSPMDIARLVRELKNLEEYFSQNAIRSGEAPQLPRYSRLLDAIIVVNKIDLVDQEQRGSLMQRFVSMQESAPVMHISFSVDPPGAYVQKIVAWLRENIHPQILVRVGLQPSIGAGCIVRTTNKAFDFSLRKYFDSKHEFFVSKLHDVVAENVGEPTQTRVVNSETPEAADITSADTTTDLTVEKAAEPVTSVEPEQVTVTVEAKS